MGGKIVKVLQRKHEPMIAKKLAPEREQVYGGNAQGGQWWRRSGLVCVPYGQWRRPRGVRLLPYRITLEAPNDYHTRERCGILRSSKFQATAYKTYLSMIEYMLVEPFRIGASWKKSDAYLRPPLVHLLHPISNDSSVRWITKYTFSFPTLLESVLLLCVESFALCVLFRRSRIECESEFSVQLIEYILRCSPFGSCR